jgi:murein peptide amidase A
MRDYNTVVNRIEALAGQAVRLEQLGEVNGLPVLCATLSQDASLPTIYINGGTHGDEPAGVEGALAFLEGNWAQWLDRLQFRVIPCLNPWGYIHNTRENAQGVDINWACLRKDVPEIALIRQFIEGKKFVATVDLHEDWESPGFYVYELYRDFAIGQQITRRVAGVCQLNTERVIEGEDAIQGLIHPNLEADKRRGDDGIPIVLFRYGYTNRLVTTETPTKEPLAKRVDAQLATLDVVIGAHA